MKTYYDFRKDPLIAVDIESKDPMLKEKGPGVYRKDGYVIGCSFSNGPVSEYCPIKHPDTTTEESEKNRKYMEEQLSGTNRKVFANGLYDLDWLINFEGFKVNGTYEDVQIAEPILDEYRRSYSLNSLSGIYLQDAKGYSPIREYCLQQGWKMGPKDQGINHLWKIPSTVVEDYARKDSELTLKIFKLQEEALKEKHLDFIYNMEMKLFPLLLQMRKNGVRLNMGKLTKTGLALADLAYDIQEELEKIDGSEVNPNSSNDLERIFMKLHLPVHYGEPTDLMMMKGLTRGNPRFDKNTLNRIDNPIVRKILELRHIKTLLSLFINQYPELVTDDRLHCQFNQLRSDEYGTVTGRFSSSNPNLQQVSSKEEEDYLHSNSEILSGLVIRKLFEPEEGCDWLQGDWNQIEYRLIAHYALGEGSEKIRKRYNEDPNTDYHSELGIMTGITNRKTIKTLNFGAAYSMGARRMAETYSWDLEEAREVYKMYHDKVPFIKETSNRVGMKAKRVGFIRTICGRKARIPSEDKSYVMFNRLIQGSAADIMKKAMVDAYEAGIFETLAPHLTIHDELDCSIPRTKEGTEAGKELKHIMENCVKLKVPIIANFKIGPNWGELKNWEE